MSQNQNPSLKMGWWEKLYVNSALHGRIVGRHAARLLRHANVQPGQRYLDVGSGSGLAASSVARRFDLDVTGVDVDPRQTALARVASQDLDQARFLTIDGRQLPFADGAFDLVFCNKVTHHIPGWPDALAEMVRVLTPGGHLLYADLMYPAWAAGWGERLLGHRSGFPTVPAVDAFIARQGLAEVHRTRRPFYLAVVLRK